MNFFKAKPRSPSDLVRGLRDHVLKLDSALPGEPRRKVCPRLSPRPPPSPHPPRPAKRSASTSSSSSSCSTAKAAVSPDLPDLPSPPTPAHAPAPAEPVPEVLAQLAQETYNTDLLLLLVQHIARFDFEARKDVANVFTSLLRRKLGSRFPTVEYVSAKRDVLFAVFSGYEHEDVALNTGMILKEMLRHEPLAKIFLYSEQCVPPLPEPRVSLAP